MRYRSIATSAATLGAALAPLAAHAAVFNDLAAVISKACEVINYLYTGAILLTIVFILLAAVKYITKGSDPKAVGEANQQLLWAAIGFAIALIAAVIPKLIAATLNAPAPSAC